MCVRTMKEEWQMRSPIVKTCALLAATIFLVGCGNTSGETAEASAGSEASKSPGAIDPSLAEDPHGEYNEAYAEWLRSDHAEKLDPKSVPRKDDPGTRDIGPPSFEEAVDGSDLVVSGKVKDITFVPEGSLTTFRVDRTAKGGAKQKIFIMQTSFLVPDGDPEDIDNAILLSDPTLSFLFEGDRAVLLLRKVDSLTPQQTEFLGDSLDNSPVYIIQRASGQYRSVNGKVRAEKGDFYAEDESSYQRVAGMSEDELMDKAEARAKNRDENSVSPSPA